METVETARAETPDYDQPQAADSVDFAIMALKDAIGNLEAWSQPDLDNREHVTYADSCLEWARECIDAALGDIQSADDMMSDDYHRWHSD